MRWIRVNVQIPIKTTPSTFVSLSFKDCQLWMGWDLRVNSIPTTGQFLITPPECLFITVERKISFDSFQGRNPLHLTSMHA